MMNYEMFVEELKNKISAAINVPIENMEFVKDGNKYAPTGDRLLIKLAKHEDAWEMCGVHVKELFEEFSKGTSFDSIVDSSVEDIKQMQKQSLYKEAKKIWDYETAKDSLFIRLLNYDDNSEELKDAIYKRIGDIAQVLYMKVSERDGNVMSTKILKSVLEKWQANSDLLSEDYIFEEALKNTERMSPPRIYRWEQMIFDPEYEGDNFMDLTGIHELKKDAMGNCLSTSKKTNGAVAVFLPGVAERLAALLESDFYMVFTSIHEVMIHNDRNVEPEDLKEVLQETIKSATPKEDYLTSRIYHYSRATHKFTCVSED